MASDLQFRLNDSAETPPLKVLIIRVGAMGDVLHGLPAIAALREKMPRCFIGWAIEPRWKDLLVSDDLTTPPIVNRIHPVPTREWKRKPVSLSTLRHIATLRRELRAEHYDVCVDLQGSIRSAVIGRMAGAKRFIGPRHPAERQARVLYGEHVAVKATHVIDQACELLGAAFTDSRDSAEELCPVRVTLPVNNAAEAWCDTKLAGLGIGDRGFVLLALTAGWGAKQWPSQRFRELARQLHQAGYRVLVNAGGENDLALTQAVAENSHALSVESNIAQLIALTRRARLVVGGDTGPVHLAAALGRPVVGLYGPTDPRRNGPYFPGSACRVLRHTSSRSDHARHAQTEAGLSRITGNEVVAAVLGLLREQYGEVRSHA